MKKAYLVIAQGYRPKDTHMSLVDEDVWAKIQAAPDIEKAAGSVNHDPEDDPDTVGEGIWWGVEHGDAIAWAKDNDYEIAGSISVLDV